MSLISSPSSQKVFDIRIAESKPVAESQWSVWVKSNSELPDFNPGNFCMLSFPDFVDPLTPRPFAIVDKKDGMYQFIYRTTGKFTKMLARMPLGTKMGLVGPLGKGFIRESFDSGRHVFIAGGVGYASLLPALDVLARKQKEPQAVFYGVKKDIEIIRKGNWKTLYSSDDGSQGLKGRVTDLMQKNRSLWQNADRFYVCGPTVMMKAVYDLVPQEKSFYFLEETMGCGVGICIGCVVPIKSEKGEVKRVRSCLEGSIFEGQKLSPWRENQWQI